MKKEKTIYWIATGLIVLSGSLAGIVYLFVPKVAEESKHLGFPGYFRFELATAKLLGAFALVLPMVPNRIKEWAYAGFAIVFICASTAHIVVDGFSAAIPPLVSLLFLAMSYVYFTKLNYHKAIARN